MKKLIFVLLLLTSYSLFAQNKIKVMSYNIHHAEGTDGKIDLTRIAEIIKSNGVDLVALQEVDKMVERTKGINIPDSLAKLTGMYYSFYKNIDYQGGEYGNAILSNYKILADTNYHYKMIRNSEQRGLLVAKVLINSDTLIFMNTHIDYRKDDTERLLNMEELKQITKNLPKYAIILCGDFNDIPNSNTIKSVSEFFTDVSTFNKLYTFSSDKPEIKIDYVFIRDNDNDYLIKQKIFPIAVKTVLSHASDHLPILVELIIN